MLSPCQQARTSQQTHVIALGTDHRHAAIQLRERLAFPADQLQQALAAFPSCVREGAVLSTCNRVEVYAVVDAPDVDTAISLMRRFLASNRDVPLDDVSRATTAYHGVAAARHMFRVASGLESMVLGEPQILGQIRDALASARAAKRSGPILSRLFTEALRTGKRARTQTTIARNNTSIAHAAVALAAHRFAEGCPLLVALDRSNPAGLPCPSPVAHRYPLGGKSVVVVGAGIMATLTVRLLKSAQVGNLIIANRTLSRAQELAAHTGGMAISLDELSTTLPAMDLAIVATGGSDPVITRSLLGNEPPWHHRRSPLLIVDLGVPRCVESNLWDDPRLMIRDVDDLDQIVAHTRQGYAGQVVQAERLIDEAVESFSEWHDARSIIPVIEALTQHAGAVRDEQLHRALRRLGHLSERDREIVKALACGVTSALLHDPITEIQRAGNPHRDGDAVALMRLFDLPIGPTLATTAPVAPFPTTDPSPLRHAACVVDAETEFSAD